MTKTPWGPIGYITAKRTYMRKLKDGSPETEEFPQAADRIIKACNKQLKCDFDEEQQEELRQILLSLEGSVAGRFWWQLGTSTVNKLGLFSLQNCAFTTITTPVEPFVWTFDALMLGSGVGYNLQREFVYELPHPKKGVKIVRRDEKDADFIVPDSREGWTELLRRVLEAHYYTGKGFSYSTICIRGKGAPIKGFGGVASGPEELCWGLDQISQVLNKRGGKKVRPIDCLDIMNIIGFIVVAGNVRRSAQIAIGDSDDRQFLQAKRWDLGDIPNWRAMSNNSVVCNDINQLLPEFWEGYKGNGEPYGLINLKLSQSCGRTGETQYKDLDVRGFNPCQPAFAKVLTPSGVTNFGDIDVGDSIWSNEGWTKVVNKWSTGIKPVYKYETTGGHFIGTANHRLVTPTGKVEAKDCEKVHTISGPLADKPDDYDPDWVMAGLYLGDGYSKKTKGRDYTYPVLCIGENDQDYFTSEVKHLIVSKFGQDGKKEEWRVKTPIEKLQKNPELTISQHIKGLSTVEQLSFLRGLYSADGSVIVQKGNSVRITYKTSSKKLSEEIQQLISSLGMRSYITTNKGKPVTFKNGTYDCKTSYDVNITKDFREFYSRIGFLQGYKMEKIQAVIESYKPNNAPTYTSVKSVEHLGEHEVFDITVDNDTHTYWTGGLNVSNCAEQSLADAETCCLAEIPLPLVKSYEDFLKIIKYLYIICKHSLRLKCHQKVTEKIVHENMRMGIGITGQLQATKEQLAWLSPAYEWLRAYDETYSDSKGWPRSIKLTTIKPSGTLSLLSGVTPGCHPGYAQYFIRRVRISADSPLVQTCREHGFHTEFQKRLDGTDDHNTIVAEFPCSYPEHTTFAKDMTAIAQLENVKWLQANWSDNSVSCTVYYKKEELEEIQQWLADNYNHNVKTCSFLLHSDHGFAQAPYEEITKERYEELVSKTRQITSVEVSEEDMELIDCEGGACPVK